MPDKLRTFMRPQLLIPAAVAIVLLISAIIFDLGRASARSQPFPYNHSIHIQNGISCLYCHTGALRGQSATLPTVGKCQGCHANMDSDTPELQAWADFIVDNPTVEWVPVAIQPDFVYFTHRPHLAAGLNCEQCHGDVSQMTTAKPQPHQDMGWCLDCHKELAPEKVTKLTDCATCHK